ncbi:MAG: recombinase family protein [Ruminococcaceae bacterium]|nr:recombinase family protein [Oscillospiraceae bacterium]
MGNTKTYHLANILDLKSNMRIAIDEAVQKDADGNYLINVGYLRVSTDQQAEFGYGLEIQEDAIVHYCTSNGYTNLLLFVDDGYTGTNMDRPALQTLIDYIKAYNTGKSHIRVISLIVARIDRLGRTLLGTLQFLQDYIISSKDSKSTVNQNKEDIDFISVAENYCRIDRNNPQSKFLLMLFCSLAEFDRDQIVLKLKRGRTARAASGKWPGGGRAPYGYRYDPKSGSLVIVPEQAEIVREIFRLYIEEKMVPQKIAERFGFCGDSAIAQILRRKTLTGCVTWNGEEYAGNHEAIIPLETWEAAQEELERRSSHRTATHYLLSGLVFCGECGAKMRYQMWTRGRPKLICYSQQASKASLVKDPNCDNEKYWADEVEEAVTQELFRLTYLGNTEKIKSPTGVNPIAVLQKELAAERKGLSRLYDWVKDGEEPDDILDEKIQNTKKKIRHIQAQIREEEDKATINMKLQKTRQILRTLESTWPYMTEAERQTVCQELIDRITIFKNGTIKVDLKLKSFLINNQK